MPILNPKVAELTPRRPRPRLEPGESLYLPDDRRPPIARDGTTGAMTPEDWAELRASVGGWGEAEGSNYNLDCTD